MSNIPTLRQDTPPALQMDQQELMAVLRTSLYPGAQDQSIKMVLSYCKAAGLDPMQKPCHIVPMWDKVAKQMRDVIMPGVGLYRTQAARSGELAGISEPVFGPDKEFNIGGTFTAPEWCKVTVKRIVAGAEREFTALEYWIENYATASKDSNAPNTMWRKRPRGQIAKCAQAQALRMAFPEMTGAQPTADEMEGKFEESEPTTKQIDLATGEIKPAKVEAPTWPAEAFNKQSPRWTKAVAEGFKTTDEILAMARSKGELSPAQEAAIKAMKKATPAPIPDIVDVQANDAGSDDDLPWKD